VLGRLLGRWGLPALSIAFTALFVLVPLALTIAVSFWTRVGLVVRPAFTFASYAAFFAGARLLVLERSLVASIEATG
jgi:ABC-type spermidine/putrescine transport system permease subunit II